MQLDRPERWAWSGARSGFTLVEVMVASSVAIIAVLGLLASTSAGARLQHQTQEYGRAHRAVQQVYETLRNGDLDARVAEYQLAPTFELGSVDVEVSFPESLLTELLGGAVPVGWRYRDLDQDGEVDLDPAATSSTSLLPLTIVVRWNGGETTSNFLVTDR